MISIGWYLLIVGSHLLALVLGFVCGKPHFDRWMSNKTKPEPSKPAQGKQPSTPITHNTDGLRTV